MAIAADGSAALSLPDQTSVLRQDNQKNIGSGDLNVVKSQPTKTVDDLIREAVPGDKSRGKSTQYNINGDAKKAYEYFESIGSSKIKDISKPDCQQKMKVLEDGTKVIFRSSSRGKVGDTGPSTLEIQKLNGRKLKFRFQE